MEEGNTTGTCKNCGETATFSITPATGIHNIKWVMTNTGYPGTSTSNCTMCGTLDSEPARNTIIGDMGPAGGIIFFISATNTGFTVTGLTGVNGAFDTYTAYFLEAAPSDEPASVPWGPENYISVMTTITSSSFTESDLTTSFGKGRRDTVLINNAFSSLSGTNRAAQLCANKTVVFDGVEYKDWFLPSIGELNELRNRTGYNFLASSSGVFYWSSTQGGTGTAWEMSATGPRSNNARSTPNRVRAVRAF